MRVEASIFRKGSEFHTGVLLFINVSFSFSVDQEESFVDASKEGSALEHDLQVSLQTEELDADVQTPEVSFCLFCRLLSGFMFFLSSLFDVYCAALGSMTVNKSHSIV